MNIHTSPGVTLDIKSVKVVEVFTEASRCNWLLKRAFKCEINAGGDM